MGTGSARPRSCSGDDRLVDVQGRLGEDRDALEVEQLSRCVLGEAVPHIPREFSLQVARTMDRILQAMGY